jgi:hypothetical protein
MSGNATISGTNTGDTAAATQAEMEAGTSNTVMVTPGMAQYHPGVAKGMVIFSATGGVITIQRSYGNISGVTRISTARYQINFSPAFSDVFYAFSAQGGFNNNNANAFMTPPANSLLTSWKTTSLLQIVASSGNTSIHGSDLDYCCVTVWGDLA